MRELQHTPLPWKVDGEHFNDYGLPRVLGADGCIVAGVMQTPANATFIAKAVNAHDDLVGTLRDIARRAEDETLGIQAARLTAIANQAHAAIMDSEAPPMSNNKEVGESHD